MEHPSSNRREVIGLRHLEDENALMTFGFDAPLKSEQGEAVRKIADKIIGDCHSFGKNRVAFVCSTQKRTLETAKLIQDELLPRDEKLGVSIIPDYRLVDLSQGRLIFPKEYRDGDNLPGLSTAWKIFWEESFTKKNLLYRFGDSVKLADGSLLYPELEGLFERPGESCAEFTCRIYDFLASLENMDFEDTLNLIVGHTATISILYEFLEIAKDLSRKFIPTVPLGELPNISWGYLQKIQKYLPGDISPGQLTTYEISDLIRPEIQEIIRVERDVLKSLITQSRHEK